MSSFQSSVEWEAFVLKALELSQKVFCLLDDDAYDWLHHWNWSVTKNKYGTKYARRLGTNPTRQKSQFIYLHKVVSGISRNYNLHFRDGNPLNMQRANMKICNLRNEPVRWWGSHGGISRFIGVEWDRYYGLWKAHIKGLIVGHYVGEIEAAEAYNIKAAEVFGGSAEMNSTVMKVYE